MATALNGTALDDMLDGLDVDGVSLHSGDPGAAGDGNVVKAAVAATFKAAEIDGAGPARKRELNAAVNITGATASTAVVNIGLWGSTQTVFMGYISRSSGDETTNAAGEYTLTTGTKITINNET